jgi:predicted oxidoreductase
LIRDDPASSNAFPLRQHCDDHMNYRRLGRSGLRVSELSFGSWVTYGNQLGNDLARECMAAAFDAGVNFFDNAEVTRRARRKRSWAPC